MATVGPQLRVLVGPSTSELVDISDLVNTGESHFIESDRFSGRIAVYIKGFPNAPTSDYFEQEGRKNVTWSIQTQGRFLHTYSSNDVLFGNTFDKPLKLPWGSAAALKFMHFVDPCLEHDLPGDKPWALSPLITTMPHFQLSELSFKSDPLPDFPPPSSAPIKDDVKTICRRLKSAMGTQPRSSSILTRRRTSSIHESDDAAFEKSLKRRQFFTQQKNRLLLDLTPKDIVTTDFCYGFLSFPTLALNLPGGISFDLKKYWDGQPVRFVCVERQPARSPDVKEDVDSDISEDDDRMFWCVVIVPA